MRLLRKLWNRRFNFPWQRSRGNSGGLTLDQTVQSLERDFAALKMAVKDGVGPGTWSCLSGQHTFQPDTQSFNITLPDYGGGNPSGVQPVNYVLRDGQTYSIALQRGSPGVFVAKYMVVNIVQRYFVPDLGPQYIQLASGVLGARGLPTVETLKFSLLPFSYITRANGFNYFWNIDDSKSGRALSTDLLSHMVLLPRTPTASGVIPQDGELFEFETPWVLERDANVTFYFRPITPALQYADSVSGNTAGFGFDDRENGRRNQAVTVQVELHGHRYTTDQDLARIGALSR